MFKKPYFLLFACAAIGILIVFALFAFSERPNSKKNAFNRHFQSIEIGEPKVLNTKNAGYYFAGFSKTEIYLGSYRKPNQIATTDFEFSRFDTMTLKNTDPTKLAWASFRLRVDSPLVYLGEGISPAILRTELLDTELKASPTKIPYFTYFFPLSNESVILKVYNDSLKKEVLMKAKGATEIKSSPNSLEKQVDGVFCVSGTMTYDAKTGHFYYAYYYRNQFICLDSNLNVLYRHNTIDTNAYAKLSVETIHGQTQLTAPAPVINRYISASNGLLYINSNLAADNEGRGKFNENVVIDVYNANDGNYVYSFYLPKYKDRKIDDIVVKNDKIIVIHGDYLLLYHIKKAG